MYLRNTAVTGFVFGLVDKADGTAITSGTVSGYRTIDGGAQTALTNAPTHKGNGQWSVDLTAAEMNGAVIGLVFTHESTVPYYERLITQTFSTDVTAIKAKTDLLVAFPANFGALGISASGHVSRVTLADTITTYTGNTPQTGDSFARIGVNGAGLTAVSGGGSVTLDSGTAQAGSAITLTLAAGASSVDDFYNGARLVITGGTGANQERVIHDYVGSTRVATVIPSWITTPDNTSTYVVQPGLTSGFSDTRDLDDVQHVWQLKRSGDGSLRSTNAFFVSTGTAQTARVGWNCGIPAICPPGSKLASMTLPTSSDSTQGINVVAKLGIEGTIAKVVISVDADAVAGDYWIATQVANSLGGGPITIYGKVTVQAAP